MSSFVDELACYLGEHQWSASWSDHDDHYGTPYEAAACQECDIWRIRYEIRGRWTDWEEMI